MPFTISVGHAQKDGRKFVLEVHSDAQGEFARIEYLAEDGVDYNAIATARNVMLLASAAEQEFQTAIDDDIMPVLRFQNASALATRMREAFRNRNREPLVQLARWIVNRITAGDMTDTQVRNAFGLTAPQYNVLKNRMTTLRDALNAVEGAAGE